MQSFSDAALTECPACRGRLRKVFSAVGVVFKGSGFYKTDSRSTGKGDKAEAGGSGADKPAADKGSGDKALRELRQGLWRQGLEHRRQGRRQGSRRRVVEHLRARRGKSA